MTNAYHEILKENIEYNCMVSWYGKKRLDETMEFMLEVDLSKRPFIRIAGDDFPREVVKSCFLKINSGHLEYVFDCIDRNTTKVGNTQEDKVLSPIIRYHPIFAAFLKSIIKYYSVSCRQNS